MGNAKILIVAIAFILVMGLFIPNVLKSFMVVDEMSVSPLVSPISNLIENGVTIFSITISPFDLLGTTFKTEIINSLNYFGLFPDWLIILALILSAVGIIASIIL